MTENETPKGRMPPEIMRLMEEATGYVGRCEAEETDGLIWSTIAYTPITSPIEQAFLCGLFAVGRVNAFRPMTYMGEPFPFPKPDLKAINASLVCYPQARIGQYRADFIVFAEEGPNCAPTVVELDGHRWHDRDERQRSYEKRRDRFMQRQGFRVARFTGAEVMRDPYQVAADALNLMVGDERFITPDEYWGN